MTDPTLRATTPGAPSRRRSSARLGWVVAAAAAFAVGSAAMALAAATVTIGTASNSRLGERVAVNSSGRTLYTLSGESVHHLLCKSSACLKFWPPVRLSPSGARLKAGSGLQGHLGTLRRSGGIVQVTLRGRPLYRFAGDSGRGQTNGEGIVSFGGTWHAAPASTSASHGTPVTPPTQSPPPPAPSPTYTSPSYGY
jgi:predicted lipoprotein with Yx(FWY)xxD motif